MALVEGTNVGFVLVAPVADPNGETTSILDGWARGCRFTAPIGAVKLTELGFYISTNAGADKNYEIAIYDHDSGNNRPGNIMGAKQFGVVDNVGWWVSGGFDIAITEATDYWLMVQLDSATGQTRFDRKADAGLSGFKTASSLPDPFGAMSNGVSLYSVYGLYEEVVEPRVWINIGDAWKEIL